MLGLGCMNTVSKAKPGFDILAITSTMNRAKTILPKQGEVRGYAQGYCQSRIANLFYQSGHRLRKCFDSGNPVGCVGKQRMVHQFIDRAVTFKVERRTTVSVRYDGRAISLSGSRVHSWSKTEATASSTKKAPSRMVLAAAERGIQTSAGVG
jgi:hypothetical protein